MYSVLNGRAGERDVRQRVPAKDTVIPHAGGAVQTTASDQRTEVRPARLMATLTEGLSRSLT